MVGSYTSMHARMNDSVHDTQKRLQGDLDIQSSRGDYLINVHLYLTNCRLDIDCDLIFVEHRV